MWVWAAWVCLSEFVCGCLRYLLVSARLNLHQFICIYFLQGRGSSFLPFLPSMCMWVVGSASMSSPASEFACRFLNVFTYVWIRACLHICLNSSVAMFAFGARDCVCCCEVDSTGFCSYIWRVVPYGDAFVYVNMYTYWHVFINVHWSSYVYQSYCVCVMVSVWTYWCLQVYWRARVCCAGGVYECLRMLMCHYIKGYVCVSLSGLA